MNCFLNDFFRARRLGPLLPVVLALAASPAHGEPLRLPLWEAGLGLGTVDLPDYRGSAVRHAYVLPAPYLVYRGSFLKADREGVRAALFDSGGLQVNLSMNVGLAARGKDNPLRQGMHPLRPTFEIGPTVDFRLWRADDGRRAVDLRLPLRAAMTIEAHPEQVGWLFSPNLHLDLRTGAGERGWKLSAQAGPIFATRRHHAWFYSVAPEEAMAGRPAYAAPGGYSGTQLAAILSRRYARHWVGAYLRYDNLNGTAFAGSPLVERHSALAGGIAVSWIFGASHTLVEADE